MTFYGTIHRGAIPAALTLTLCLLLSMSLIFADTPKVSADSPYGDLTEMYDNYIQASEENFDSDDNELAWRQVVKDRADDPLLKAYWGSSLTMVGRDSFMPWNKIKYVEKGLEVFAEVEYGLKDEETRSALDNRFGFNFNAGLETLLIMGQTYVNLPNVIFKTRSKAEETINTILEHPAFDVAPARFRQEVRKMRAKLNDS